MFKIFLLVVSLVFCTKTLMAKTEKDIFPTEWTMVEENTHVRIFYKSADCYTPYYGTQLQKLIFKVENKTSEEVFVNFEIDKKYTLVSTKESADEKKVRLVVKPSHSIEGVCYPNNTDENMLSIFLANKSVVNMAQLEKFSIVQLKTTILK